MNHKIRCFQHCDRSVNILCFQVPHTCPLCEQNTEVTPSRIPPYQLPCPFVIAANVPCSVVVKPTVGSFLSANLTQCDLHAGVTSSSGIVYEYDEAGIQKGSEMWTECVVIPVVDTGHRGHNAKWDRYLEEFISAPDWLSNRYNEKMNNCFDFVLGFLHRLNLHSLNAKLTSKETFCFELLGPQIVKATKYVTSYKYILSEGFLCQPVDNG